MMNDNTQTNLFDLFGDLFDGYKPEDEQKEAKGKKTTTAKDKKELAKEQKAETLVKLPVNVYGRNFLIENFGEGEKTLAELQRMLSGESLYPELRSKAFISFYQEDTASVYIGIKSGLHAADWQGEDGKEQLDFTYMICDGSSRFQMDDEGDISLEDLWRRFIQCFPEYETYSPYVDKEAGIIIPLPNEKERISIPTENQSVILYALGESITCDNGIDMQVVRSLAGFSKKPADIQYEFYQDGVNDVRLCIFAKSGSSSSVAASKKGVTLEDKDEYSLPLTCFMATWGASFSLTSDDFGGKEKVSQNDIKKHFEPMYSIFSDKSRKASYIYVKETNTLSIAFFSGTKGSTNLEAVYEAKAEERLSYGPWELIRSEKELANVCKMANYQGIYVPDDCKEPCQRIEVLPLGIFRGIIEYRPCDIDSVRFESRVPKISKSVFSNVISLLKADMPHESIVQIWYNPRNKCFNVTSLRRSMKAVTSLYYEMPVLHGSILVITIHSHNTMPAYFSDTDNLDENYTGLFGVVGNLDKRNISMAFRCGMEGTYDHLQYADLFEV